MIQICGSKFLNNNLNGPFRSLRASLKLMRNTTTHRTNFMKAFIRNGNLQGLRLVRNWDKKTTPQRFIDIDIKADTSKLSFGTI